MSVSKYISIQFSSVLCWGVQSGAEGVAGPMVSPSPQLPWGGSSLPCLLCCDALPWDPFETCTKPFTICVATGSVLAFLHPASTSVLA